MIESGFYDSDDEDEIDVEDGDIPMVGRNVVSHPTRWSLAFILEPLHWSSNIQRTEKYSAVMYLSFLDANIKKQYAAIGWFGKPDEWSESTDHSYLQVLGSDEDAFLGRTWEVAHPLHRPVVLPLHLKKKTDE